MSASRKKARRRCQGKQPSGQPPNSGYRKAGKRLHHLSPDCLELLTKAKEMIEIDVRSDPHYHIADSKLG